jgi:hypothetical protein
MDVQSALIKVVESGAECFISSIPANNNTKLIQHAHKLQAEEIRHVVTA